MSQCCGKIPDEEDVDHISQSIFDDLTDDIKDFPVPEDFGCDQLHCHYDPATGHNHYTASDSSTGSRYSWDTDSKGNYIEGTAHATWIGEDGNKEH